MVTKNQKVDLDPFFLVVLKLKTIKRAGWVSKVKVKEPESVADHTFSMCAMGMALSDVLGLDTGRVMKMTILHDLAESIVGDYMPEDLDRRKKISLERKAMSTILARLPEKTRIEYSTIWAEYLAKKTDVSRFVHRLDKFEMALQAGQYVRAGYPEFLLEPFFKSARKAVDIGTEDVLTEMLNSLKPMSSK